MNSNHTPTGRSPKAPYRAVLAAILVALAAALLLAGIAGCSASPQRTLEGTWKASATSGKAGSLSDLTISPDGTFLYGGKNAYGGIVRFSGTYTFGTSDQGPWIKLVYSDFPDRPFTWFYVVKGDTLTVSTQPGNLKNGLAMVFTRQKQ